MHRLAVTFLALVALPNLAFAFEWEAVFSVDSEYESNQLRSGSDSDDDAEAGWSISPSLSLGLTQDVSSLALDMDYRAAKEIYLDDTFDDFETVTGSGTLNWAVVSNTWNIYAENYRSIRTVDNRLANTRDNAQEVDESVVGTNFSIPVGRHSLTLQAEHSWLNRDEVGEDSDEDRLSASYRIPLNQSQHISINHSESEIDLDEFSYDNSTSSLSFVSMGRASELALTIGRTEVSSDDSALDTDGLIGSFTITRQLGDYSSIAFNADREVSDRLNQRRLSVIEDSLDLTEQDTRGGQVYTNTSYSLEGETTFGTNRVSLSAVRALRDSEVSGEDEWQNVIQADLERPLNVNSSAGIRARWSKRGFSDAPHDIERSLSARYSLDIGERMDIRTSLGWREQKSSSTARDYDGWVATITFNYRIGGNRGRSPGAQENTNVGRTRI